MNVHAINRRMLWIWEGCAPVGFATYFGFICIIITVWMFKWYVNYIQMLDMFCGWTSDGCLWWDVLEDFGV
ncbi:hypothetical protein M6B38_339700 [Iris pallida]|uniref:Transmembrane protein n=1 Tax=Iris pallida TaxID=29817 RepID=A0AAX6GYA0_IRIPA|nr:hypothetical protein M6B38_339700 [Iris pallida]